MNTNVLTTTQAAQLLGCSARTVHRHVTQGTLKPIMRLDAGPNGAYLFDRADVQKLAAKRAPKVA